MDVSEFIQPGYTYAVIGATNNPVKYGYKVFRDLRSAGWEVIPVNPKRPNIDGVQSVATLGEITRVPDVAVFVVPAEVGLKVMTDAARLGVRKLWFQPGAESPEIRQQAKKLGCEIIADGSCIMVERLR